MSADTQATIAGAPSLQRQVDYSGRTIGPLRLARSMRLNIVGGSSIMAALAVLWPNAAVTIIFLQEHLGASKTLIGFNLTLVTLAMAAALPGAWLFSGLRRRRGVWIALTAIARMFMFGAVGVVLCSGYTQHHALLIWVFCLCLFVVQAGGVFTSTGWWSWMGDLIPESMWGTFFGRRFRWLFVAQSVTALGAGLLLDQAQDEATARLVFTALFSLAAVLAVLDPLLFTMVPEPVRPEPRRRSAGDLARDYLEPLRDRAFLRFLIGAGSYGFFVGMPMVFLVLFVRGEEIDGVWVGGRAPVGFLTLMAVVTGVGIAASANLWGRLADRIGHRTVWILGSLAYLTYVAYFFINETNYTWLALGHAALYGLLMGGHAVALQNMALSMAPPGRREFYFSMFQAWLAVTGALGPVLGGWLADEYRLVEWVVLPSGQPACFVHLLLAIAFGGLALTAPLMATVPDAKGTALLPWVGRLLSGDLFRTVWNIGVLATPSSVPRRVRALRRISQRDENVLLPEIAAALDDPDMTVRREAMLALGRLGTPEALDLLRWYLHEPDGALRAPSVEAIAQTGVPDREELLKRALHDPDRRVRRTAAEALGRSAEAAAGEDLRLMLTDEQDGEVLVSAAVALSRRKEFGAVREMLHLALYSADTTVRSQILLALADLLGGTSDFQHLWRQHRHWRGAGFARLAGKLRRQARTLARMATPGAMRSRAQRRRLVGEVSAEIEAFLEYVQADDWLRALSSLRKLAFQFIVLRYRYQGDEETALEFVSAVAPEHGQRYWLVGYLQHACEQGLSTDAPWDGLTLLALHVLVHGGPPGVT